MFKIKTHQVLLHVETPFDILKPDIANWTHSITETEHQQEKNN